MAYSTPGGLSLNCFNDPCGVGGGSMSATEDMMRDNIAKNHPADDVPDYCQILRFKGISNGKFQLKFKKWNGVDIAILHITKPPQFHNIM